MAFITIKAHHLSEMFFLKQIVWEINGIILARCIDTYGSWTCQEMTELRTKASKKLGALKHIQRARLQRGRENDTKHQTTAGLAAQKTT